MNKNLLFVVLAGLLYALSFPPFLTGFVAYTALIPLFILFEDKRGWTAFRWGYIAGLAIAVPTIYWIGWVTIPGLVGVLLVWPLYIALYALLHTTLLRTFGKISLIFVPFLWTSVEYLQSLTELAFPWNYIGYSQTYYLPFIQFAEYTSIFGVGFWVVLLNVHLYYVWKYRKNSKIIPRLLLSFFIVFFLPAVHGFTVLSNKQPVDKTLDVSLIQGNIPPNEKWDGNVYETNFNAYKTMTQQVLSFSPDLIIWPETAMPFYLRSEQRYLQRIRSLLDSTQSTLMTGTIGYEFYKDGEYEHYNTAMMIDPKMDRIQRYHKIKLVPFSERVPYKHHFPFTVLRKALVPFGIGDYNIGREIYVFQGKQSDSYQENVIFEQNEFDYNTGVGICYESVFPDHMRSYVNKGADFLIIITNDAWFGRTTGPFQHAQMAVFRAIENRRDIARCANTGISCIIDKYGYVRKATKLYKNAIINDTIELNDQMTFYTLHGNLFVKFIAGLTFVFIFIAIIKNVIVHEK